jgi:hypothetical protein
MYEGRRDCRLAMRSMFKDKRRGGLVQSGAEQAAKKAVRGDVMPPVLFEMEPCGALSFVGIEQGAQLLEFRRGERLEVR